MIVVTVKYSVKPGTRDIVMEGTRKYMAHTWTEKGCICYDHLPCTVNDTDVIVLEKWETKEDLIAHTEAPEFAEFRAFRSQYNGDGPFTFEVYEAVEVKL